MSDRISYWRSQVLGRPVPFNLPKSPAELPAIRERGKHVYDFLNESVPEVGQFHEHVTMRPEGKGRSTPDAEIYVPKGDGPHPVMIHLHGGAWFTGDARNDRKFAMTLTAHGLLVVNVNYALAPELPYPHALEDVIYAARWVVRNIARYGGKPDRIAIGGASAGGNLAVAAALALHGAPCDLDGADLAGQPVRFSALVPQFAVLDLTKWLVEPGYSAGNTEIPIGAYLGPNFTMHLRNPLVSPNFSADLDKLPPTYLTCGALDVLLSHSFDMAAALAKVNVPVTVSILEGADHEFFKIPEKVPDGLGEIQRIVNWVHRQLR